MRIATHTPSVGCWLYNAFSRKPFSGNTAGVFLTNAELPAKTRQRLASELAAPTSVFLWPRAKGAYAARFHTPLRSIRICGHALIAGACAMRDHAYLSDSTEIAFETEQQDASVVARLDLASPIGACSIAMGPVEIRPLTRGLPDLLDALGLDAADLLQEAPPALAFSGLRHALICLRSPEHVEHLRPEKTLLDCAAAHSFDTVGVFAVQGTPLETVRLRDFCPAIGNFEEAASGSTALAACLMLASHGVPLASPTLVVQGQTSGRRGQITIQLCPDEPYTHRRGTITGNAIQVASIAFSEGALGP